MRNRREDEYKCSICILKSGGDYKMQANKFQTSLKMVNFLEKVQ